MGIWIRSQDKKCLVKTQESWITIRHDTKANRNANP